MTESDSRIYDIVRSMHENVDELKIPIESIIQRLRDLGITGNETDAAIRRAAIKAIDYLREGAKAVEGTHADVKTIHKILDKIFKPKK